MRHLLVVLVGIPLVWHLAIVAGTVYDAGRTGMGRRKWGAIALAVPLFGAFAYLLERSERRTDADRYDDGTYHIHESAEPERDIHEPANADGESGHDHPRDQR